MTSSQYRGGPVTTGSIVAPGVIGSGSSCACSVKGAPQGSASVGTALYAIPPSYAATLPHKITPLHQGKMNNIDLYYLQPILQLQVRCEYQPQHIRPWEEVLITNKATYSHTL